MRQVGAAPQSLEKPAPLADTAAMLDHLGQPAHDTIVEAGHLVRGRVLQVAQIDPGLEHGRFGPDVRSFESQDFAKFHIRGCVRVVAGNRRLPVNVGGQLPAGGRRSAGRRNGPFAAARGSRLAPIALALLNHERLHIATSGSFGISASRPVSTPISKPCSLQYICSKIAGIEQAADCLAEAVSTVRIDRRSI